MYKYIIFINSKYTKCFISIYMCVFSIKNNVLFCFLYYYYISYIISAWEAVNVFCVSNAIKYMALSHDIHKV